MQNNKTIVLLDKISSFPRDMSPFALRIENALPRGLTGADVKIHSNVGLIDYVRLISRGEIDIPDNTGKKGDCCAYIALGYYEAINGKTSAKTSVDALRYISNVFDRYGWAVKFIVPVIRSQNLTRENKIYFAAIHAAINDLINDIDYAEAIKSAFEAIDPTCPNLKSITGLAESIAHSMSVRTIKEVVQNVDKPASTIRRRRLHRSRPPEIDVVHINAPRKKEAVSAGDPQSSKKRIIITEEAPIRKRRKK